MVFINERAFYGIGCKKSLSNIEQLLWSGPCTLCLVPGASRSAADLHNSGVGLIDTDIGVQRYTEGSVEHCITLERQDTQ